MRAGEHHGVGATAVLIDKAAGDFGGDGCIVGWITGEFRLGKCGEF